MTKDEAVKVLADAQGEMKKAKTKDETIAVLKNAGGKVGYTPAFRCLVQGLEPDKSVRWKD